MVEVRTVFAGVRFVLQCRQIGAMVATRLPHPRQSVNSSLPGGWLVIGLYFRIDEVFGTLLVSIHVTLCLYNSVFNSKQLSEFSHDRSPPVSFFHVRSFCLRCFKQ